MNAMTELETKLTESGIPYEKVAILDGYGLCYPDQKHWKGDVVQHRGSYGHQQDLFEAMGFNLPKGDVAGYLTVDEAYGYFAWQYENDKWGSDANA